MADDIRLPPHNTEAEEAVIGAIMLDPHVLDDVQTIITSDAFWHERTRQVYEAMLGLPPDSIDQITVANELVKRGQLDGVGGNAYLSSVIADCPGSMMGKAWARVLAGLEFHRKIVQAGTKIVERGYDPSKETDEVYKACFQVLGDIEPPSCKTLLKGPDYAEAILALLASKRDNEPSSLLSYGYVGIDNQLGGMAPAELIVIGARPRVGKTQLMLEMTLGNVAKGKSTLFCSAEMSIEQLIERHLQMGAGLPIRNLRHNYITSAQWDACQELVAEVATFPIYFLQGTMNIFNITTQARHIKKNFGLSLVVVDYIQLLRDRYDKKVGDNLHQRVGYITGSLKDLAKDLGVPVIAASQFSREVESREGHRPRLSDLKESGDIEAHADVVFLLHRNELYDTNVDVGILEVGLAKSRQIGNNNETVLLRWNPGRHCYEDMKGTKSIAEGWKLL